jgi:hypothetical protein
LLGKILAQGIAFGGSTAGNWIGGRKICFRMQRRLIAGRQRSNLNLSCPFDLSLFFARLVDWFTVYVVFGVNHG